MKRQHPIRKIKPPFQVIDEAASVPPEMWDKLLTRQAHPIRKMQHAIRRAGAYESRPDSFVDSVAARHVKPLLDALEVEHSNPFPHGKVSDCEVCRLLAAWKEPIK